MALLSQAQYERAQRAMLDAQLAKDQAELSPEPGYMPRDWLRVRVGGHEFETCVQRLGVALVDGEQQSIVFTCDGHVWQQRAMGGWMLSWCGPKSSYEPILPGEHRILGTREERLQAIFESRREARRT